jgi:WD40 repeat protein
MVIFVSLIYVLTAPLPIGEYQVGLLIPNAERKMMTLCMFGVIAGEPGSVNEIVMCPRTGLIFAALSDGRIDVLEPRRGWATCSSLMGHQSAVTCCRLSPNGSTLFSGAANGWLMAHDIRGGALHGQIQAAYAMGATRAGGINGMEITNEWVVTANDDGSSLLLDFYSNIGDPPPDEFAVRDAADLKTRQQLLQQRHITSTNNNNSRPSSSSRGALTSLSSSSSSQRDVMNELYDVPPPRAADPLADRPSRPR